MNGTSRPSTNETAAASSQTAAGAREREAPAGEQRQHDERDRRHGEPGRRRRRRPASSPEGDLERAADRREHDQERRTRTCARASRRGSRAERTPGAGAPPPTRVGGGIVGGSELESGLPTMSAPRRPRPAGVARRRSAARTSTGGGQLDDDGTAPTRHTPQPGGPHGPLERRPLEDRDVRLARVRRRRVRDRRRGRHEDHRPEHGGAGRVRPRGQDPRRRLQAARRRERPGPEQLAPDERSGLHGRDRGRRRGHLRAGAVQNVRSPLDPATPARSPRTGTRRSSSSRSAATPTRRPTRSTRSSTGSTRRSRPTRSSSSASSATPARSTGSTRSSPRTWRRPGSSRSRSR